MKRTFCFGELLVKLSIVPETHYNLRSIGLKYLAEVQVFWAENMERCKRFKGARLLYSSPYNGKSSGNCLDNGAGLIALFEMPEKLELLDWTNGVVSFALND